MSLVDRRPAMHPLEPLSAAEVEQAVGLLKRLGKLTPTTRVVSISLKEQRKELVHALAGTEKAGAAKAAAEKIDRLARFVLFDNGTNTCLEGALSLAKNTLLEWREFPGKQPTMTIDEQIECEQAVLGSAEFRAALKKQYGIEDTRLVMVD